MSNHEDDVNSEMESCILTWADVNEQIMTHIAPLTKQLEAMTWLIQGMFSTQHPNIYSRAGTSASFSAASYPFDNHVSLLYVISVHLLSYYCLIYSESIYFSY